MHGPFTLAEARAAGLTLSTLKGSAWTRLGHELYCKSGAPVDPWLVLRAWCRVSPGIVFSGRTAAWMHGLDYAPTDPVEAIAPPNATSRTRFGITIRRQEPRARDVVKIRNLGATSLNRTLLDFASGQAAVEALVAIDMAIRLRKTTGSDLVAFANDRSPAAGCVRLRELAALGEPAESPMETRVRWLFIDSGLPRPLVQTDLFDKHGSFIGRADLYYPEARLVIEFDGVNHKNRLVADNRRQNNITSADFTVLRFTTADLMDRPHVIVAQVRGILAGATSSARQPSQMSVVRPANATLTSHGR